MSPTSSSTSQPRMEPEPPVRVAPVPAVAALHRLREPGLEQEGLVHLNRNERLEPLPQWFMDHVRRSLVSALLTDYPVTDGLYRQLSGWLDVPESHLLLTAGSDAAIKALYQAYVRSGDTVVMLEPSYAMFSVYARMFQARAAQVTFNESLELDTAQLLESVVPGVRLVIIANPNQPTGTLLPQDVLRRLVERTGAVGALLAVDEAYYPFSRTTVLPWIKEVPHLAVTRTFSKAAGLAGLRIGFVAAPPEIIGNLYKVRSVHDVNSVAIRCASQVLAHPQVVDDYATQVDMGGRLLMERARVLGLSVLPTRTNFMLIRVAPRYRPARIIELLRQRRYLVKGPFSAPGLAGCIRVTLGPPALMAAFADVLAGVLSDMSGGR